MQNTGLPTIYRLSVSRYVDNPQHYSISLHAIVGGCVDGFLFLGRFDNNNECNHIVKPDKAVLKNDIQFTLTAGNSMTNQHFHEIGFPHIHLADANYACGSIPEKVTPKFVEKCKNNNFEENIEYIMHLFGISHYHNFYKQDEKLLTVLDESKKFAVLRDDRKTDVITDVSVNENIKENWHSSPADRRGDQCDLHVCHGFDRHDCHRLSVDARSVYCVRWTGALCNDMEHLYWHYPLYED